eukprot:COSAG01_NODE_3309_length_6283_cov_5.946798_1_plen_91_part_10
MAVTYHYIENYWIHTLGMCSSTVHQHHAQSSLISRLHYEILEGQPAALPRDRDPCAAPIGIHVGNDTAAVLYPRSQWGTTRSYHAGPRMPV